MEIGEGVISTTGKVWEILTASKNGDLQTVKQLAAGCPELLFAKYNYTPPIHFAVREGHTELVKYLLDQGAYDPGYTSYPFLESLETIAADRNHTEIMSLLTAWSPDTLPRKKGSENGRIDYQRTELQREFELAVDGNDIGKTEEILKQHPEFAKDETYFWGEGILLFAAKENNRAMFDLLTRFGAKIPGILKWAQFYYFEHEEGAAYVLEKGMNPNTMSWHHVTLLHDMAQKGNIYKAGLLLKYGADINAIEEEYQSTPLGLACRWGQREMVEFLLSHGADPNKAGAPWATPLAWARNKGFAGIEKTLLEAGVG